MDIVTDFFHSLLSVPRHFVGDGGIVMVRLLRLVEVECCSLEILFFRHDYLEASVVVFCCVHHDFFVCVADVDLG